MSNAALCIAAVTGFCLFIVGALAVCSTGLVHAPEKVLATARAGCGVMLFGGVVLVASIGGLLS